MKLERISYFGPNLGNREESEGTQAPEVQGVGKEEEEKGYSQVKIKKIDNIVVEKEPDSLED